MTDKARELLGKVLADWEADEEPYFERMNQTIREIRAYLAEPRLSEKQKEALAKELCFHNHGDRLEQYAEHVFTSCTRCGGSGCEQDAKAEPDQDREPIYMFRRLGQDDFITCSKKRFDELSEKDHMFQTKVAYNLPRKPFVRLSEEEMQKIIWDKQDSFVALAVAIEDALEEKNK